MVVNKNTLSLTLLQNQPDDEKLTLAQQLELTKKKTGKSWNLISKELSLSPAVISTWRKGEYTGNNTLIDKKVAQYIELQRQKALSTGIELEYVETSNNHRMLRLLEKTQVDGTISAVLGDTGTSKSTTIKQYIKNHNNVIYVSMNRTYRFPVEVLRVIHSHPLVNRGGLGSLNKIAGEIIKELTGKNALIIIDQCDYLNKGGYDIFRTFNDESNHTIGICYVGLPAAKSTLEGNEPEVRQLSSRIVNKLELPPFTFEECKSIISKNLPQANKFSEELYSHSGGNIRMLTNLIYNLKNSVIAGTAISSQLIEKTGSTLFYRNIFKKD